MSSNLPLNFGSNVNFAVSGASSSSASNKHAGLGTLAQLLTRKSVINTIVGVAVMAVITWTERSMDAAKFSFGFEWIVLSLVAVVSFVLLAKAVRIGLRLAQTNIASMIAHIREEQAEAKLVELAKGDSRVLAEIRAARDRQEAKFV